MEVWKLMRIQTDKNLLIKGGEKWVGPLVTLTKERMIVLGVMLMSITPMTKPVREMNLIAKILKLAMTKTKLPFKTSSRPVSNP